MGRSVSRCAAVAHPNKGPFGSVACIRYGASSRPRNERPAPVFGIISLSVCFFSHASPHRAGKLYAAKRPVPSMQCSACIATSSTETAPVGKSGVREAKHIGHTTYIRSGGTGPRSAPLERKRTTYNSSPTTGCTRGLSKSPSERDPMGGHTLPCSRSISASRTPSSPRRCTTTRVRTTSSLLVDIHETVVPDDGESGIPSSDAPADALRAIPTAFPTRGVRANGSSDCDLHMPGVGDTGCATLRGTTTALARPHTPPIVRCVHPRLHT